MTQKQFNSEKEKEERKRMQKKEKKRKLIKIGIDTLNKSHILTSTICCLFIYII